VVRFPQGQLTQQSLVEIASSRSGHHFNDPQIKVHRPGRNLLGKGVPECRDMRLGEQGYVELRVSPEEGQELFNTLVVAIPGPRVSAFFVFNQSVANWRTVAVGTATPYSIHFAVELNRRVPEFRRLELMLHYLLAASSLPKPTSPEN
jgi:hypothetical protein